MPHRIVLANLLTVIFWGCQTTQVDSSTDPSTTHSQTTKAVKRMPAPSRLPEEVRLLVADRMETHGYQLTQLIWGVLYLERDVVAQIADDIVGEPRPARPLNQEADALNSRLPDRYFELQDELVARARTLSKIARDGTDDRRNIVAAFSSLTATCVECPFGLPVPKQPLAKC